MQHGFVGVAATVLLAWGVSACATLSEGECRTANWYELGRLDGANGQPRSRLNNHAEACGEYGIIPNPEAYFEGRDDGLARYCTPQNGFEVGRSGGSYQGVCPPGDESGFLAGYRDGRAIHQVAQELANVERDIDRLENRLASDGVDEDERRALRLEIRALDREFRSLNRELVRVESNAATRGNWNR